MALKYTRPIASARAVVRLAEQADLSALMDVNRDEQVTRFLPCDAWKSPADADAWFARMTDLQTQGLGAPVRLRPLEARVLPWARA